MHTLVGLSYSPWSEKARWALDHHRVPFAYQEYLPMIGEPALRVRMRKPLGRVSVPVLFDESGAYGDSFEIARYAERTGTGKPLFGEDRESSVAAWNERSEAILRAGRALVVYRTLESEGAQAEALPSFVPGPVRPALSSVAKVACAYLRHKYATNASTTFDHESSLRDGLDALRRALDGGKKTYLLNDFSYADVAMAAALQMVKPVNDNFVPIGPATREVWTHVELARQYADLLAWRDALYAKHRRA
jgi:glutathione S-transferase